MRSSENKIPQILQPLNSKRQPTIIKFVKISCVLLACFSVLFLACHDFSFDSLRVPSSGDSPAPRVLKRFGVTDEDGATWNEFEVVAYDPRTAADLNSSSGEAEAVTVERKKQDGSDRLALPVSGDLPAPSRELKRANITDENGVMTSDMFEGMYYGPVDLSLSAEESEAREKRRQEEFHRVRASRKVDAGEPIKTA